MNRLVVLDTNCLLQMLSVRSEYHFAWNAFRSGYYSLCVSNEILSEYLEVIARIANYDVAQNIVSAITHSPYTLFYSPQYRFQLIEQDPDDNKFVDCAIIAGADYIVSEDSHFKVLQTIPFPKVNVIRLIDFLKDLKGDGEKGN